MDGKHELWRNGQVIGSVTVTRQGLYTCVSCRCTLPENTICRLFAQAGERVLDLGIMYPIGSAFGLDMKLPSKSIGDGELRFTAGEKAKNQQYYPLDGSKRFPYLCQLEHCRFQMLDGKPCLKISIEKNA